MDRYVGGNGGRGLEKQLRYYLRVSSVVFSQDQQEVRRRNMIQLSSIILRETSKQEISPVINTEPVSLPHYTGADKQKV